MPIVDLRATASATDAARFAVDADDPELSRLLGATADGFAEHIGSLPAVRLAASTTIPRSVGLAGSSALVIAALRSLGGWNGHRWDVLELAELALAIERDRLGIAAGLQDRLVQSIGRPAAMTFDPIAFEPIEPVAELALFIAYQPDGAEPSGVVHRSLRRRFDGGDPAVVATMRELAGEADRARRGLLAGDIELLGTSMDRSFDLRCSMIEVGDRQRRLVAIGRDLGAWVNSAGSGGSIVGLATDAGRLPALRAVYEAIGAVFLEIV